jgi:hypothetical protein
MRKPIKVRKYNVSKYTTTCGAAGLSLDGVGGGLAFDSVGVGATGQSNTTEDPVELLCTWCLSNLSPEQLQQLCAGLSETDVERPAQDGEGVTGYPGGRRDGPQAGNAGPWRSKLPDLKKNGAMDSGIKALARSVTKDVALRGTFDTIFALDGARSERDVVRREQGDLSFDAIFSPSAGGAEDGKRDDFSLDGMFDGGGSGPGESTPRMDHLNRSPLWTTLR